MKKRLISIILIIAMTLGCTRVIFANDAETDIKIIYTNDAHCGYQSYSKVATLAKDADLLIDGGDAVQGDLIGTVSKGEYLIDIMNKLDYDLAGIGNHEFGFGVDGLKSLMNKASFPFVCCNFIDLKTGKTVFEPYKILEANGKKIAFVGVVTPATLTQINPGYFKDDLGNYIYSFCEGNNGKDLYDVVQKNVTAAKAEADYVFLVAHLGIIEELGPWSAKDVAANVSGVDVILDGHSHSVYTENFIDKAGEEVLAVQTGTKLENAAEISIKADGTFAAQNISLENVEADKDAAAYINSINDKLDALSKTVVAKSTVDLTTKCNGVRAVRNSETNLGDLCADAYKKILGADIGLVNGGGIRADIAAGSITFGDIIAVFPFNNQACLVEVRGQQIKDALEMGCSALPAESGGFLQVSGITYTVDTTKPSNVVKDESGNFVKVDGEYRVRDIMIGGKPIELNQTYKVASHDFMLKSGGDGFAMFGEQNIRVLRDNVMLDNQVLIDYITKELGGVVGKQYEAADNRISLKVDYKACPKNSACPMSKYYDLDASKWYHEGVHYCLDNALMNGIGNGVFNPNGNCTRGMLATILYRVSGSPETEVSTVFFDLKAEDYFAKAVSWAYNNSVVNGMEPHTFGGNVNITREQFATMLYNYAKLNGVDVDKASENVNTLSFIDIFDVSSWANAGIHWCLASGILTGKTASGELYVDPQGLLTRAEAAAMIQRYCAQ